MGLAKKDRRAWTVIVKSMPCGLNAYRRVALDMLIASLASLVYAGTIIDSMWDMRASLLYRNAASVRTAGAFQDRTAHFTPLARRACRVGRFSLAAVLTSANKFVLHGPGAMSPCL